MPAGEAGSGAALFAAEALESWPLQYIVLLLVICARVKSQSSFHSSVARLHCSHYCNINIIARLIMRNIRERPPPDPPCGMPYTIYNIGSGNIV